jgi:Protein of unknown function (DUF3240)
MTTDKPTLPDGADHFGHSKCLLTIALPTSLQEEVLDLLHSHTDVVQGFTVVPGHGMGQGASLTTMMERVEGRARRALIYVVMNQADVDVLLLRMRGTLQSKEVFYWAVPLLASGRLT